MRHSGWSPDPVLRLFPRGTARFSDDLVHELLTGLPSGLPVAPAVEVDYPAESVLGRAQQTLQAYRRACQRAINRGERASAEARSEEGRGEGAGREASCRPTSTIRVGNQRCKARASCANTTGLARCACIPAARAAAISSG